MLKKKLFIFAYKYFFFIPAYKYFVNQTFLKRFKNIQKQKHHAKMTNNVAIFVHVFFWLNYHTISSGMRNRDRNKERKQQYGRIWIDMRCKILNDWLIFKSYFCYCNSQLLKRQSLISLLLCHILTKVLLWRKWNLRSPCRSKSCTDMLNIGESAVQCIF